MKIFNYVHIGGYHGLYMIRTDAKWCQDISCLFKDCLVTLEGYLRSYKLLSYQFLSFPLVEREQAWYFGMRLHLHKLLCSAVIFRLLHQLSAFPLVLDEQVACVCYFPRDVSNYS